MRMALVGSLLLWVLAGLWEEIGCSGGVTVALLVNGQMLLPIQPPKPTSSTTPGPQQLPTTTSVPETSPNVTSSPPNNNSDETASFSASQGIGVAVGLVLVVVVGVVGFFVGIFIHSRRREKRRRARRNGRGGEAVVDGTVIRLSTTSPASMDGEAGAAERGENTEHVSPEPADDPVHFTMGVPLGVSSTHHYQHLHERRFPNNAAFEPVFEETPVFPSYGDEPHPYGQGAYIGEHPATNRAHSDHGGGW